ncbi:hypothetical protein [Azospirillum doebereinerae]
MVRTMGITPRSVKTITLACFRQVRDAVPTVPGMGKPLQLRMQFHTNCNLHETHMRVCFLTDRHGQWWV